MSARRVPRARAVGRAEFSFECAQVVILIIRHVIRVARAYATHRTPTHAAVGVA